MCCYLTEYRQRAQLMLMRLVPLRKEFETWKNLIRAKKQSVHFALQVSNITLPAHPQPNLNSMTYSIRSPLENLLSLARALNLLKYHLTDTVNVDKYTHTHTTLNLITLEHWKAIRTSLVYVRMQRCEPQRQSIYILATRNQSARPPMS